ncbi:MAG: tyrosine-type recombinase/integrase, partial [Bryobacteraceae bacterium]
MSRINIVKQVKIGGRWEMRSIPKKSNGQPDWNVLPEGTYFLEWREAGKRRRTPAGTTVSQALEARRRKHTEREALKLGFLAPRAPAEPNRPPLEASIDRYLDQIDTLKKPNTYRKYRAVLERFAKFFPNRRLEEISVEEFNDFVVRLRKGGMAANTVLHNTIIIAQFCKRNGRSNLTRQLQLPEKVTTLPREYTDEELLPFFASCDSWERALFSTFLLTGFRDQEVMYLTWNDVSFRLCTARVTAKPDLGFFPKRWEEREVPVPSELAQLLENHPRTLGSSFLFPSPTGNREQHLLDRCKAVADRAGLDPSQFNLKTFRSTYATRMLRAGFDVRTVQHW